ncbi:MAG: hypothetical protein NW208_12930 [Bryobacter sp.]|nr:hypothetical protein [Bryobacter sp.]
MRQIQLSLLLAAVAIGFSPTAQASTCPEASLDFYRDNFPDGFACSNGVLNYYNFQFVKLSSAGPVTANDIIVRPSATGVGIDFRGLTSTTFNRTITEREQYFISYTVDPPPIIAGDEMRLNPPTGPMYVSRWTCPDDIFNQAIPVSNIVGDAVNTYSTAFECLSDESPNPFFLQVTSDTGVAADLSESVTYPELANFVSVRMIIDLLPGEIVGLTAVVTGTEVVPEPAAFLPLGAGVAGLVLLIRRRRMVKSKTV